MNLHWQPHAATLAAAATHPLSPWRPVIEAAPRHLFTPRWLEADPTEPAPGRWIVRDGAADPDGWLAAAYADRTLVTRVGPDHADQAEPGTAVYGGPSSSATLPSLLLQMYEHAMLGDEDDGLHILDAGTGSGYGAYLLATRYGDHVLTADVDPYLVEVAADRCRQAGQAVRAEAFDVTGDLPGEFDRIVATFSVPHVPASWVKALRPRGRIVACLADTTLICVLDKQDDGTLRGRTAWDRAGFMAARHGAVGPDDHGGRVLAASGDGRECRCRFPVVDLANAWPLWSVFGLENPGVRHEFTTGGGRRRALMWADDGSWARAQDDPDTGGAVVVQGGPRHLWDALDDIRHRWLRDGDLPCYGARVKVEPDGTTTVWRGRGQWAWKAVRQP